MAHDMPGGQGESATYAEAEVRDWTSKSARAEGSGINNGGSVGEATSSSARNTAMVGPEVDQALPGQDDDFVAAIR